jgi:hypothetical protein
LHPSKTDESEFAPAHGEEPENEITVSKAVVAKEEGDKEPAEKDAAEAAAKAESESKETAEKADKKRAALMAAEDTKLAENAIRAPSNENASIEDVCMPFIVKLLTKMPITIWVKLAATYHEILNKIQEQIDLGMLPSAHWRLYFKGKDLSELTQPLKGLRKSLMASDTQEAVTLNMVFRAYGGGKTPQTQKKKMTHYFVKQTTPPGEGWCHD